MASWLGLSTHTHAQKNEVIIALCCKFLINVNFTPGEEQKKKKRKKRQELVRFRKLPDFAPRFFVHNTNSSKWNQLHNLVYILYCNKEIALTITIVHIQCSLKSLLQKNSHKRCCRSEVCCFISLDVFERERWDVSHPPFS